MPSRRDLIRMTDEEARAYLREQCKAVLGTIGPDGMPHLIPLYYGVDAADRLVVTTFGKAQKVKNVERDARATLLVESGDTYHEIRSVMAYCTAEIISDPIEVRANMDLIRTGRPMDEERSPAMKAQITASYAKRHVLRLTPYRYVSWDHTKLGSNY